MSISENMRGAILMMLSMGAFALNDTFFKSVAGDVPLFQAILIRGVLTSLIIVLIALWRGEIRIPELQSDRRAIFWRTFGELGSTFCYLLALFHMPLANATAIVQSLPLVITFAGAIFFAEVVGWRRYSAIGLGFCGVLLIVRPGSAGFDSYSVLAMVAVVFLVLRDLSTRRLSQGVPSLLVAGSAAIAVTMLGAAGTLLEGWQPIGASRLALLSGASLFIISGYVLSIMVMRVGEIGFVSPFRYTALIWAIVLGIVAFGEVPDIWMLIGSAVVIGTGIYNFVRERNQSRVVLARAGMASERQR
ncbi:MAG: DMT family transporter [Rhodobacteraceae bacterium]|nr:DMT family transporter [Paracoccaceae bacterium]